MTEDLVYFRSKMTGKCGYYPAHFGKDWADFEEVDPNEIACVSCVVTPTAVEPVASVKATPQKTSKEGK
jgi:hypothetical protein